MNRIGLLLAGRYKIIESIGCGGMADVYRAVDQKLNRAVAVKILRQEFSGDDSFIVRFQQEAMAAASIQNPYVVNVYDVGEDNGINYIVMELADGITLKQYIRRKGKLEIVESINIAMQIVTGIKDAHAHGIIHRDIKPQNVMVDIQGKAKVMDFGIARAVTSQTITANTVGSVHYISPEQARGSVCDARCDIYSIGITMYEMITGKVPFDGESSVAIALAHIKEPIIPPSTFDPLIPVSLEKIILKCTQKKPEQRYNSADELLDDLKKALMTPDEDFVNENATVNSDGGTKIFDEMDKELLNAASSELVTSKAEEDYLRGYEEEEAEEEKPEEKEGKIEKIVLGIGIAAMIIIIMIVVLLFGKAFHIFKKDDPSETEPSTEIATSLAEDEKSIVMPKVTGYLFEEAKKILEDQKINWYTYEYHSHDTVEEGYVFDCSVEPGQTVKADTVIKLSVSSGKDPVFIPDSIIGQEQLAAVKALTKLGLKVDVEKEFSDEVDEGLVIRCKPSVGEQVPVGKEITLYISAGTGIVMVKMPELYNKSVENAKSMLSALNLKGTPQFEYSQTVDADYVIRQDIEPGTEIAEGTTVVYYISLGPLKVSVPSLKEHTLNEADEILSATALSIGDVSYEHSDTIAKDKIIRQSAEVGSKIDAGSRIDVVVSLGEEEKVSETVTVPDIRGYSEQDALDMLERHGLKGSFAGNESGDYEEGEVCRQEPENSQTAEKGSAVKYYITVNGS